MTRTQAWLLCLVISSAPELAASPFQSSRFRGATQAVAIDVSVRRGNTPVTGLRAQDFELTDNGVRQAIELDPTSMPVDVSLVFDKNYLSDAWIGGMFATNQAKITALLAAGDRLQVITFATDVQEVLPMGPAHGPSRAAEDVLAGRHGLERRWDPGLRHWSLFDALLLALAKKPELDRRHLVVLFCLGVDSGSAVNDGDLVRDVAARSDALLHVVLWNQRRAPTGWRVEGLRERYTRETLTSAAIATGGEAHDADNGVKAFKAIFEGLRQSYILRYTVAGVSLGGWHAVTVKLPAHSNYDVRARAGYVGR